MNKSISNDLEMSEPYQHFLIVTQPVQSHINPACHLARRLLSAGGSSCHVTFSTAVSAHRRMFPSLSTPDQETTDCHVSFIPFSDGHDSDTAAPHPKDKQSKSETVGPETLSAILDLLATRGRQVTCLIHTLFLEWAADVARDHGIPAVFYWIQPATVLSVYYHYFHGYDKLISCHVDDPDFTVSLPGLIPLKARDLPSFVTITNDDHPHRPVIDMFQKSFDLFDRQSNNGTIKPKLLINTSESLETDAVKSMSQHFELYPIGPTVSLFSREKDESNITDMFTPDNEKKYMQWLDTKPEKSVVYLSFGSLTIVKKEQMKEIQLGLKESGFPYLFAVRKNSREGVELETDENNNIGLVVEWCDQVKVLSHPSIGCFVTHHGWNSTVESLACGVPMVGLPQWSDQGTNARLVEELGVGVRGEVNGEGVMEGGELKRCLEVLMGRGEGEAEIRRRAEELKETVRAAMGVGGSSERNLKAFLEDMGKP